MRIVLIATKMLRIERKSLAWERKESNRCQGRGRLRNENASEAFDKGRKRRRVLGGWNRERGGRNLETAVVSEVGDAKG